MRVYYVMFLIYLFFGIICAENRIVYAHQKEKHEGHDIKKGETEQKVLPEADSVTIPPASSLSEKTEIPPKEIEIGSFNLIQIGGKHGYTSAVLFIIFITAVWIAVLFLWRNDKG